VFAKTVSETIAVEDVVNHYLTLMKKQRLCAIPAAEFESWIAKFLYIFISRVRNII
jgi:hypothetical protein